jgi:hypothetical protein
VIVNVLLVPINHKHKHTHTYIYMCVCIAGIDNVYRYLGVISKFWTSVGRHGAYWAPQNIRPRLTKLVAKLTWRPGFVHPWYSVWSLMTVKPKLQYRSDKGNRIFSVPYANDKDMATILSNAGSYLWNWKNCHLKRERKTDFNKRVYLSVVMLFTSRYKSEQRAGHGSQCFHESDCDNDPFAK